MAVAVQFSGAAVGALYDPTVWVLLGLALVLGLTRRKWWWFAAYAIIAGGARWAIAANNHAVLGVRQDSLMVLAGSAVLLMLTVAYGAGRGIAGRQRASQS